MRRWTRILETTTNIAVLVLCCGIGFLLIRNSLFVKSLPFQQSSLIGTRLNISGVSWNESSPTVVLALSTQCHFCSESSPFYKLLSQSAAEKHRRVIAVFPQRVEESKDYLSGKDLRFDQVVSLPLDEVHASGTPTVFLVDNTGKITATWVGKLQADKEHEILSKL